MPWHGRIPYESNQCCPLVLRTCHGMSLQEYSTIAFADVALDIITLTRGTALQAFLMLLKPSCSGSFAFFSSFQLAAHGIRRPPQSLQTSLPRSAP